MNVFILDNDMKKSVRYHPDKHIVKMPLEATQLLCNAYHFINEEVDGIYRLSHRHHPLNKWVIESVQNWIWLRGYVLLMGEEYTYRYGKTHKSVELAKQLPIPNLPDKTMTPFVKCVPEEFRNLDIVEAYRQYFIWYKQHLKKYTKRDVPDWWT